MVTNHSLATPVEQPSLAGLTHNVLERSFVIKSCQSPVTGNFSSSSFLFTTLFIVKTPESASCPGHMFDACQNR